MLNKYITEERTRHMKIRLQTATGLKIRTQMNEVYTPHFMFIAFVKINVITFVFGAFLLFCYITLKGLKLHFD